MVECLYAGDTRAVATELRQTGGRISGCQCTYSQMVLVRSRFHSPTSDLDAPPNLDPVNWGDNNKTPGVREKFNGTRG